MLEEATAKVCFSGETCKMNKRRRGKAWVISVDMGYGHQRAAHALRDIAFNGVITANSDKNISEEERVIWMRAQSFYEWVSRMNDIPVIGKFLFGLYDRLAKISPFYPYKKNTAPNFSTIRLDRMIRKGFCKSLIEYTKTKEVPFVSTFFIPAVAANYYGVKDIYCVVTDTDLARPWIPLKPEENRINYFVPCRHTYKRMLSYGVSPKNVFLTGFPLPKECIGGKNSVITRESLGKRLVNLDPEKAFLKHHYESVKKHLGKYFNARRKPSPVMVTFVLGGAGAQRKLGVKILQSLKGKLVSGDVKLCLVAGTHLDLKQFYLEEIEKLGLTGLLDKNLSVLCELTKKDYFSKFNQLLNKTDILWTKPSELSFFTALGIPVIISDPIGSHEHYNRQWLFDVGSGLDPENPDYFAEWFDDLLVSGALARKAWNGFLNAQRMGVYKIEKILFG